MEECYGVSLHAKHGGYVFSLLSAVGIYYGTTRIMVQNVVQTSLVGGSAVQRVVQVGACETHSEHVLLAESEFILYVINHFRSGGGGECEEGLSGQQFPEVAEGKVTGSEVVAPL